MGEQINAVCSICGNGYHLCLSCKDKMKLSPWKMYTDSASCYQVFQVVKGYNTGVYNKEEFKSKLKNIDLSNLENYRDHIKTLIKDALKEDEVVVKTVKQIETAIETDKIVEEVVENVATEEEIIVEEVETIVPRKRNYKVNKAEETE